MADRKKTNSLTEQDTAPVAMLDGEEKVSIDQASAEAFIAEKRIGERIKRLRLKKSMGLVELGRQTGLSASFLSQLETGRVVPTLRNLARVSIVFGKDLSYFFEAEPQAMFRIHRKKERMRMPQTGVEDPSYYFESLGYMVPDRQLDPYFAEFLPRKAGDVRPHVGDSACGQGAHPGGWRRRLLRRQHPALVSMQWRDGDTGHHRDHASAASATGAKYGSAYDHTAWYSVRQRFGVTAVCACQWNPLSQCGQCNQCNEWNQRNKRFSGRLAADCFQHSHRLSEQPET
jgi:transcriptional regulator with XRE-family HTH domain